MHSLRIWGVSSPMHIVLYFTAGSGRRSKTTRFRVPPAHISSIFHYSIAINRKWIECFETSRGVTISMLHEYSCQSFTEPKQLVGRRRSLVAGWYFNYCILFTMPSAVIEGSEGNRYHLCTISFKYSFNQNWPSKCKILIAFDFIFTYTQAHICNWSIVMQICVDKNCTPVGSILISAIWYSNVRG